MYFDVSWFWFEKTSPHDMSIEKCFCAPLFPRNCMCNHMLNGFPNLLHLRLLDKAVAEKNKVRKAMLVCILSGQCKWSCIMSILNWVFVLYQFDVCYIYIYIWSNPRHRCSELLTVESSFKWLGTIGQDDSIYIFIWMTSAWNIINIICIALTNFLARGMRSKLSRMTLVAVVGKRRRTSRNLSLRQLESPSLWRIVRVPREKPLQRPPQKGWLARQRPLQTKLELLRFPQVRPNAQGEAANRPDRSCPCS